MLSIKHLRLHLVSLDFDSVHLKRTRHLIIFNTDYLVPPTRWATMLAQRGRLSVNHRAEEAKLKEVMRCPLTGQQLMSIAATKQHLHSA